MKKNLMIMCMALFAMLLATTGGFAQLPPPLPASCGTYAVLPTGANVAPTATNMRIAVAANFYGPVQNLLNAYLPTLKQATTATVCSNATGTFEKDINENYPTYIYDLFFAADDSVTQYTSAENCSTSNVPCAVDDDAFLYANGIPVLFGYVAPSLNSNIANLITDVSYLITQSGSNFQNVLAYSVPGSANGYQIATPTANTVAIADPGVAPYGLKAATILSNMYSVPLPNPLNASNLPQFGSVSLNTATGQDVGATFNLVGTGSTFSGFVGKSQICSILPIVAYVQFPNYTLQQYAVQFDTSNNVATALNAYIQQYMMVTPDPAVSALMKWDVFLVNNCYQPLPH